LGNSQRQPLEVIEVAEQDPEMVPVECEECDGFGVTKEAGTDVAKLCTRCEGRAGYLRPRFRERKQRGDIEIVQWRKGLPIAYGDLLRRVPPFDPSRTTHRFKPRPDCDNCDNGPMIISGEVYSCRKCGATKPR
jgi:hypothetical protein